MQVSNNGDNQSFFATRYILLLSQKSVMTTRYRIWANHAAGLYLVVIKERKAVAVIEGSVVYEIKKASMKLLPLSTDHLTDKQVWM